MAALVSVAIDPPAGSIATGDSLAFDAIGSYDDSTSRELGPYEVTFSSSDPAVASVVNSDTNWGLVYANAPGSVTLTATSTEGPAGTAAVTVTAIPADAASAPEQRFSLAFDQPAMKAYPAWTAIDDYPNLVTSYTIDRGRSYETDQFDSGTATVTIADPDGILDPTNPSGPFFGKIRPLLRAAICRRQPVTDTWRARYSGWVDEYSYEVDPPINRLVISLVDLFEIASSAEMQPGAFGTAQHGNIVYGGFQRPDQRINDVLHDLGVPPRLAAILTGNVYLQDTTYSPGESALTVIQEAADAEFPGVANVYVDRIGRLCFHGRPGRFDPEGVSAAAGDTVWNYHTWKAGDGTAVSASPADTVQVRALAYSLGLSKIINTATALPAGTADNKINSQRVSDKTSVKTYGVRAWSASNLLTLAGDITRPYLTGGYIETKRFARFYLHNYKQPRRRINELTFRSVHPDDPRAAAAWELLCLVDIGDTVLVTVAAPGGGGFVSEPYFVEGVREECQPGTPEYDDVTVTLDLSPRSYYSYDPWATPLTEPDDPFSRQKRAKAGKPKPNLHGGEHNFGGPDPIGMDYENVGEGIGDGGSLQIADEGTVLPDQPILNFTGDAVEAVDGAGQTDVKINAIHFGSNTGAGTYLSVNATEFVTFGLLDAPFGPVFIQAENLPSGIPLIYIKAPNILLEAGDAITLTGTQVRVEGSVFVDNNVHVTGTLFVDGAIVLNGVSMIAP